MKKKHEVGPMVINHINSLQVQGKIVRFLRFDNAGEHRNLIHYCNQNNVMLEMTSPNTPQHNGVVERGFSTDLNLIRAMYQSKFTLQWPRHYGEWWCYIWN